ncbi:MAG TPA: S24/S26 family peptidase [Anaerolineae bacterium]|nr:S24/S26 family peptidase [Anaerolineae bacterium]
MADSTASQVVTWLPLLRESLAREGSFRWPLHGTSMLPTLPADCEIEVRPLLLPVRLGELIVFVSGDTLIVHRFVRSAGNYLIAHGDHRSFSDPPLLPDQVLGRVVAAYQHDRLCWPRRFSPRWIWIARHHVLRVLGYIRHHLLNAVQHGRGAVIR